MPAVRFRTSQKYERPPTIVSTQLNIDATDIKKIFLNHLEISSPNDAMPFIPPSIPPRILADDASTEYHHFSSTSHSPEASPASISLFPITTPSPSPTSKSTSSWSQPWDGGMIILFIALGVSVFAVVLFVIRRCVSSCCKSRRRSRNARHTERQAERKPISTQNRRYSRMKSWTSSNSPQTQSPEDVPLENVRARPRRQTSTRPSRTAAASPPSLAGEPPAYTWPTEPQRVFLNTNHNSINTTLPVYNRHHNDQLYDWESPAVGTAHTRHTNSTPAPPYERYWNPWTIFDQTGRDDHRPMAR
jgi:hypothetical protein